MVVHKLSGDEIILKLIEGNTENNHQNCRFEPLSRYSNENYLKTVEKVISKQMLMPNFDYSR